MEIKPHHRKCTKSVGEIIPADHAGNFSQHSSKTYRMTLLLFVICGFFNELLAQSPSNLFFREDWKETEAALPVTQEHVSDSNLLLSLHGAGKEGVKKSNHPEIPNDPYYIWSGECRGNWAVSLQHNSQKVDLTGPAEIHWRSKQSGFRQLRLIIKLTDDTWLVSDQYDEDSEDWRTKIFKIADLHWRELDIEKVTEGSWVDGPDLSRVEEVQMAYSPHTLF